MAKPALKTGEVLKEGREMWYVIQVRTGTEEKILQQCREIIPGEILERGFLPYCKEQRRYRGAWHVAERVLFPGYVFVVSRKPEALMRELKKVVGLAKLLRYGEEIVPLTKEEREFLLKFGKEEQVVELSVGVIEGNRVTVREGPLKGLEGFIKKIDRHKRRAFLEMEMFGRTMELAVGLEIVSKKV